MGSGNLGSAHNLKDSPRSTDSNLVKAHLIIMISVCHQDGSADEKLLWKKPDNPSLIPRKLSPRSSPVLTCIHPRRKYNNK